MRPFVVHLFAATSVPFVVGATLFGLWTLSGWLAPATFVQALIHAAVPVIGALAIAMYAFYSVRIILAFRQGQSLVPTPPQPGAPPPHDRVTREHWKNVGIAVVVFHLLLGIGMLVGAPAEGANVDLLTYYGFLWLGRSTLLIGATGLVFSITLMTTHALRGVLHSYSWAAYGVRPADWRRNFPLDVALAALPIFVVILVA